MYIIIIILLLLLLLLLFIIYFTSVKITIKKPQLKLVGLLIPNKLNEILKIYIHYTNNTKI